MWDLSQIKVDALWMNQRNCSFTVNIGTFCRVALNVEQRYHRVLVVRPQAADEKTVYRTNVFGLKFPGNSLP